MTWGNVDFAPSTFASEVLDPQGASTVYNTIGGAFPGLPGTGNVDQYRSIRTSEGWITEAHGPRGEQAEEASFGGASDGGAYSFEFDRKLSPYLAGSLWAPWAGLSGGTCYGRRPGSPTACQGPFWVTTAKGRASSSHRAGTTCSSSARRSSTQAPESGSNEIIYERSPGGPTHVVSLLPGDVTPSGSMAFLMASDGGSEVVFTPGVRNQNSTGLAPAVRET